jgi:hypothetical protein
MVTSNKRIHIMWLLKWLFSFILGSIRFVPSRFVRPPIEFRKLYGPNICQTVIDSFFPVTKCIDPKAVSVPKKCLNKSRQIDIRKFLV